MRNMNERPVCHRAEDLVTYMYGEANAADAQDFAGHLQQCDACRAEFAIFQGVHESIVLWRNEALGSSVSPAAQYTAPLTTALPEATQFVQHERKLSAVAALREFFRVSPLWLRGATGVAALLLCVLVALAASRMLQKPAQVVSNENEPKYSQKDLDNEVQRQLHDRLAQKNKQDTATSNVSSSRDKPKNREIRVQLVSNGSQSAPKRPKGLTRQEREQLAADLRLIPGRDNDELPFVFTDEPE